MIFRVKIALFLGLNPKVERNYRGGIGNFEGEIERESWGLEEWRAVVRLVAECGSVRWSGRVWVGGRVRVGEV